jgi:hypothetical protein
MEEHVLFSERLQIERKTFTISLRENPRGRFMRITEDVAGRHDTIIVPAPGLGEFLRVVTELAGVAERSPPSTPRPQEPAAEPEERPAD